MSTTPILFRLKNGQRTVGYDAMLLPMICEVYLKFRVQKLYDDGQRLATWLHDSGDDVSEEEANKRFNQWRASVRSYIAKNVSIGKSEYFDGVASVMSMSYSGMKSVKTKDAKEILITHTNARLARLSETMKDY